MGNCLNKFRKNKVSQDPGAIVQGTKNRTEDISEILSMFSTSPCKTSVRSKDENKMVENCSCPNEDKMTGGLEDMIMKTEESAVVKYHGDDSTAVYIKVGGLEDKTKLKSNLDKLSVSENKSDTEFNPSKCQEVYVTAARKSDITVYTLHAEDVKKPVFFQVDFVQGMRNVPPRLASRMGQIHDKKKCEPMKLTDEDELMMDEIMEEYDRNEKLRELEDQLKAADCLRQQHLQSIKDKAKRKRIIPPTRACVSRVD